MNDRRLTFQLSSLSLLQDDKTLASLAEKYQPKEGVSYIGFTFHGSAPDINMKGASITPATMETSLDSAIDCMVDFEHQAEDIPIPRDDDDNSTKVVGHIVELVFGDIPALDDPDAWMFHPHIPKEPILTRGVMALYTRIAKVKHIANEVQGGASWYFSFEIGQDVTPPAIWLKGNGDQPHEIIPWSEAPEDLRLVAGKADMMEYNGREIGYLMGGAEGKVQFIGGAVTRSPAGLEQRRPGNALMFIANTDGVIQGIERISAVWTTAYINSLPDSSFAVIEGDNARHLPFIDVNGKVDLPHLRDAFAMVNKINPIGGPETAAELKTKALKKLESYRKRLQTRKEGNTASVDGGIIVPITIETYDDLLGVYEMIDDIMKVASSDDTNTGGDKKMELTQEQLDAKIAEAVAKAVADAEKAGFDKGKTAGIEEAAISVLEKAVADGTHIPADQVDTVVAKKVMATSRETAIAALPCDDDTKADFVSIAGNEERYPLDEDGQKLFDASMERWVASLKPADADSDGDAGDGDAGDGDSGDGDTGDGNDSRRTSSTGDGGNDFDPGNGGGDDEGELPPGIPQVR